jgi:hypothetical protein
MTKPSPKKVHQLTGLWMSGKHALSKKVGVHGLKGSEVQGSVFVPGLHLECVFMRKASCSSC